MTERHTPTRSVLLNGIDFDAVLSLVRVANRDEASDLLLASLKVAFNNGEAFGMEGMAKITDDSLARAMSRAD